MRRMISHEAVREMVDGIEINGEEIPSLIAEQPPGRALDAQALGDDLHANGEAALFVLIDFARAWNEWRDDLGRDLIRMHTQVRHGRRKFRRMYGIGRQRPALFERPVSAMKTVRNHDAVERLG